MVRSLVLIALVVLAGCGPRRGVAPAAAGPSDVEALVQSGLAGVVVEDPLSLGRMVFGATYGAMSAMSVLFPESEQAALRQFLTELGTRFEVVSSRYSVAVRARVVAAVAAEFDGAEREALRARGAEPGVQRTVARMTAPMRRVAAEQQRLIDGDWQGFLAALEGLSGGAAPDDPALAVALQEALAPGGEGLLTEQLRAALLFLPDHRALLADMAGGAGDLDLFDGELATLEDRVALHLMGLGDASPADLAALRAYCGDPLVQRYLGVVRVAAGAAMAEVTAELAAELPELSPPFGQ